MKVIDFVEGELGWMLDCGLCGVCYHVDRGCCCLQQFLGGFDFIKSPVSTVHMMWSISDVCAACFINVVLHVFFMLSHQTQDRIMSHHALLRLHVIVVCSVSHCGFVLQCILIAGLQFSVSNLWHQICGSCDHHGAADANCGGVVAFVLLCAVASIGWDGLFPVPF